MLDDGSFGRAAVPSGASTGLMKPLKNVMAAQPIWAKASWVLSMRLIQRFSPYFQVVTRLINKGLIGMITLDGTENKSRLGANAMLGVSLCPGGG